MYRIIISTLLFFLTCTAVAQSPKEQLVGTWHFKRGIGAPCSTLIEDLYYYFQKDGSYEARAKMKSGGVGPADYHYTGTYKATDTTATAFVDGYTIGPYPYTIEKDLLTVSQPEYNCKVELVRDDF